VKAEEVADGAGHGEPLWPAERPQVHEGQLEIDMDLSETKLVTSSWAAAKGPTRRTSTGGEDVRLRGLRAAGVDGAA
jgi:hypothetical protein